jgi:tRNA (guanosine-2'-O-)-methyltransferase
MGPNRLQRFKDVIAKRQNNITVILENVFDPHNIAAVMRTADSIGIQELYIINSFLPPEKQRQKYARRSSGSAIKWLTIKEYNTVSECVQAVRKQYTKIYTTHLSADAVSMYSIDFTEAVALVFGNEGRGCSTEMLAASDGNFHIPQVGMTMSLNISVACAVTLFEAYRQKELAGHYNKSTYSINEQQQLLSHWIQVDAESKELKKETFKKDF